MSGEWVRHQADLARGIFAAVVAGALALVVVVAPNGVVAVSRDVGNVFLRLPLGFTTFVIGFVQFLAVVAPIALVVVLLFERRIRLLGLLALAAVLAGVTVALVNAWLAQRVPVFVARRRDFDSWFTDAEFPSSAYLAGAVAVVVASRGWVNAFWRRIAWAAITVAAVFRIITATEVPLALMLTAAIGAAAGSFALVFTGAPRRRTDDDTLIRSLARSGVHVEHITAPNGEASSLGATTVDGRRLRVRVFGRDERDTATLLRLWHTVSRRGLGDHRPTASPRRAAEHEMLAIAMARAAGAEVPDPVTIAFTPDGAALLVLSEVDGVPLAALDPATIHHDLLVSVWCAQRALHERRIAHRALDTRDVIVRDGRPVLTNFTVAALDASDEVLACGVANLLVSLSVLVGVDRAVASARDGLGTERLAAALPLVQATVLTPVVRREIQHHKGLLDEIRTQAQRAAGVDTVELTKVRRITIKGIVSLVGSVVLGGYLLSLASDWSRIWEALQRARLADCVAMVVLVFVSFVFGTISMMGSVTTDLPFLRTLEVMFAQSFLNRFTPANSGGMALRARYLQLEGVDVTVGVAAVGLTEVANGIAQVLLVSLFLVWGGSTDALGRFSLPSDGKILAVVVVVGAGVGAVLASRWGRRTAWPAVKGALDKVLTSFRELGRRPAKLVALMGGTIGAKVMIVIAFAASVQAFGVHMPVAQAGALYMVGATVGNAVPTPGGVGGVEAALTAALLGAGVDAPTAAAIVVFFRLFTFWLPTLPGWLTLLHAQRAGIV